MKRPIVAWLVFVLALALAACAGASAPAETAEDVPPPADTAEEPSDEAEPTTPPTEEPTTPPATPRPTVEVVDESELVSVCVQFDEVETAGPVNLDELDSPFLPVEAGEPQLGPDTAGVTIIEYGDYQ